MARQLNIRSDRAYELASRLAARRGQPVARVVEDALEAAEAKEDTPEERYKQLKAALEATWALPRATPAFSLEDMYDEDGLPI